MVFLEYLADCFLSEIKFLGNVLNRNILLPEVDNLHSLCWCGFSHSSSVSLCVNVVVLSNGHGAVEHFSCLIR